MTIWATAVFVAALVIALTFGYGIGVNDGYKNGFADGVEDQKLKAIEKLEPEGDAENEKRNNCM